MKLQFQVQFYLIIIHTVKVSEIMLVVGTSRWKNLLDIV